MRNAHAVAEVREAERALMARVPEGSLMQRAATGLASVCAGLLGRMHGGVYGSRVVVLAGSGDNGGDALYAGTRLARRGAVVTAVAAGTRVHPGGSAALLSEGGRLVEAGEHMTAAAGQASPGGQATAGGVGAAAKRAIAEADLVIDGLLGIGGRGGLREPAASLADRAAASGAVIVATDLPSGIDADTGEAAGAAIRADVTVTFGTWKPGLLIDPGASHAGVTELIDIGLGPYLGAPDAAAPQAADVASWLPHPSAESDKYRRGVLGVLAGSDQFTGAAVLAVGGAVRGGAGMVRLVAAPAAAAVVRERWPEAVITVNGGDQPPGQVIEAAGRVQAWVVGPGMGTGADAADALAAVLATDLPVLVDADGLTVLAEHRELLPRAAPTVVTPHAGELARLLDAGVQRADIEARRLEFARRAAAELGVAVLLKGSTTVIAGPGDGTGQPGDGPGEPERGHVLVNPTGVSWLATAGSGDVLSGLAGALLAQGVEARRAAAAAAYLHGIAARLAADGAPIGASDLIAALPAAVRTVREQS